MRLRIGQLTFAFAVANSDQNDGQQHAYQVLYSVEAAIICLSLLPQ